MKKLIPFIVIILLNLNIGKAQDNDHLRPISLIFHLRSETLEYYAKLNELLLKKTGYPYIQFITKPAFAPESVLLIESDIKTRQCYMIYRITKESIWYSKNQENIEVEEYKAEIDTQSVQLIRDSFYSATSQVRYSSDSGIYGKDGVSYYFFMRDTSPSISQSGKTWSPEVGTKMKKLVDISNELIELTKSTQVVISFDKALETEIKELTAEINKTNN